MIVDTITYAKAHFSSLIKMVEEGEEIIIKKAGKPVAVIHKYEPHEMERQPGALKGKIKIAPDFDKILDIRK